MKTLTILLLLLIGPVFLAGCQSDADFVNCGNGVIETGEACDGTELDPENDTCAKNGLGPGNIRCSSDCTLDLSSCSAMSCDPVTQTGCNAPFACYVTNTSGDVGCIPASTGALDQSCSAATYCEPGLVCGFGYDGKCHKLCWNAGDCTGIGTTGSCNTTLIPLDGDLGFCL